MNNRMSFTNLNIQQFNFDQRIKGIFFIENKEKRRTNHFSRPKIVELTVERQRKEIEQRVYLFDTIQEQQVSDIDKSIDGERRASF